MRHDIVIYGATGYTGHYILKKIATNPNFKGLTYAIAGRNEAKLKETLEEISKKTDNAVTKTPIIVADSTNEESMRNMAKQAKVIINAVGPSTLYGEPVVRAAVQNGASYVDISGEFPWIEKIQLKYGQLAKDNGVYVVSACAFGAIPVDLGVQFLKRNFDGDLNHVDTFCEIKKGPKGYTANDGTLRSIMTMISENLNLELFRNRRAIMPDRIVKGTTKPRFRLPISRVNENGVNGYALTFNGTDDAIVNRTQYHDAIVNNRRPVHIAPYLIFPNIFQILAIAAAAPFLAVFSIIPFTRNFILNHPDLCTLGFFKKEGPPEDQVEEASFALTMVGYGYSNKKPYGEQHTGTPDKKMVVLCEGPDPAYNATSSAVLSAALSIIKDNEKLPQSGGVYTSGSAFENTNILEYLESFGIKYSVA